jgi:hypothetical protein
MCASSRSSSKHWTSRHSGYSSERMAFGGLPGMTIRQSLWVGPVLALAALGMAASLLAGCHSGGEAPRPAARKAAAKNAAQPAEPSAEAIVAEVNRTMASGVPMGVSAAPVDIHFDLASVPNPGAPFTLEVAVLPAAPAPVLRIEVTGGEGLAILEPEGPLGFEKVQAGSVTRLKVRASSAEAGTRLVQVRATLELPEGPEWRVFAFPVVIGAPAAPAVKAPVPAAKGAAR